MLLKDENKRYWQRGREKGICEFRYSVGGNVISKATIENNVQAIQKAENKPPHDPAVLLFKHISIESELC